MAGATISGQPGLVVLKVPCEAGPVCLLLKPDEARDLARQMTWHADRAAPVRVDREYGRVEPLAVDFRADRPEPASRTPAEIAKMLNRDLSLCRGSRASWAGLVRQGEPFGVYWSDALQQFVAPTA